MNFEKSIKRSINWISKNLIEFSISKYHSFDDKLAFFKPFGELVLTMNVLILMNKRVDWAEKILAWAWRETNEGQVILNILLARPDLIVITSIYSDFKLNGFSNKKIDALLEHYSKDPYKYCGELPVWRLLDIENSFSRLKLKKFDISMQYKTWLYKNADPWIINNDLAYAITHEIFYITDFGTDLTRLDLKILNYVRYWLPFWTKVYIEQQNWDIVAEMIMVSNCINNNNIEYAYKEIINSQFFNGVFPAPFNAGTNLIKKGDNLKRKTFLKHYHTTIVGLMSLVMASEDLD